MALYPYGSTSEAPSRPGITEFEILKARHRFLRDEDDTKNLSWDEQLASKYYASLYREFAVCDLKHYKSGNFALRWRTENEVLSGAGETTCGNTRCEHHHPHPDQLQQHSSAAMLTTLELPFAYVENGECKSALVKVVLCSRCFDKLMWKRRKERGKAVGHKTEEGEELSDERTGERRPKERKRKDGEGVEVKTEEAEVELRGSKSRRDSKERRRSKYRDEHEGKSRRKRSSRSRSPRAGYREDRSPVRRSHRS